MVSWVPRRRVARLRRSEVAASRARYSIPTTVRGTFDGGAHHGAGWRTGGRGGLGFAGAGARGGGKGRTFTWEAVRRGAGRSRARNAACGSESS